MRSIGAKQVSPEYQDRKHPRVAAAATKLLRKALIDSEIHAVSTTDLWVVFEAFVRRHQYGQIVEQLVAEIRDDLTRAIREEYEAEVRASLKAELLPVVEAEIRNELYSCGDFVNSVREELMKNIAGFGRASQGSASSLTGN